MEAFPEGESMADSIRRSCLEMFLPSLAKTSLNRMLKEADADGHGSARSVDPSIEAVVADNGQGDKMLTIADVSMRILPAEETNELLVPSIRYYDNPQHTGIMRNMLKDLQLGDHLLLVGNQGVGKNKIVDRLMQLLNRPREYIQLHRDTTVQTLTQQPSVENGQIVYHPSPLVRALESGSILVVDEADKAPTHVTSILKNLVESGDMILADGRRVVASDSSLGDGKDILRTHKDFRMIVLANR